MPYNTLAWNRIRYTLYAPIYDAVAWVLNRGRKQAIESLHLATGDNLLIAGCGSGLDLPYVPEGVHITLLDLAPAMLTRACAKKPADGVLGDVENLPFVDQAFDAVLLHCIVAVSPNPAACIAETHRVLKPGGKVSLFDKFAPDEKAVPWFRRLANEFTETGFSSIIRKREDVLRDSGFRIANEHPAPILGAFRVTILAKD